MACTMIFYALLLAVSLRTCNSFLMTRFKNPNEYVAKDDWSVLDDLDETTYEYLMEELPELRDMIKNRKQPLIQIADNETDVSQLQQYYDEYEDKEDWNGTLKEYNLDDEADNRSSTTELPKPSYITRWPQPQVKAYNNHTKLNATRRNIFLAFFYPYWGALVAKCYWCGMNKTGIPKSPLCHDMFDSQNFRARTLARYFRAHCHFNPFHGWAYRKKPWRENFWTYTYRHAAGLINGYYGRFIGGCYKRFLDVGSVYTQRGCRAWWPRMAWHWVGQRPVRYGRSYASHRFTAMERSLRYVKKDMCMISPHASLTPFHRSISLWVRYHICICHSKWCNAGTNVVMSPVVILSHFVYVVLYYLVMYNDFYSCRVRIEWSKFFE